MTALSSYFFITLGEPDLESFSLTDLLNLEVFRKTLTANDKYPVGDCENLPSPTQMQLSLKPKSFSDCFVPFLDSSSNFKHFEKRDDRHSYFLSEITHCRRPG